MRDRASRKAVREAPVSAAQKLRRGVLVLIGASLALMLWMAVSHLAERPSLNAHRPAATAPRPEPDVTPLMQRLQNNPKDVEALSALAQHFGHLGEWERAEMFAMRAVLAAPDQTGPLYQLALLQHGQGRHAEAAISLEKSLDLGNDPAVRYSLGILYRDYLNEPEKGVALLRQVLDDPAAPAELKQHTSEALTAEPGR